MRPNCYNDLAQAVEAELILHFVMAQKHLRDQATHQRAWNVYSKIYYGTLMRTNCTNDLANAVEAELILRLINLL